jgi:hypothetical protein
MRVLAELIPEDAAMAAGSRHARKDRRKPRAIRQLLGVSVALVQSWEQGQRSPAICARRLLDEVNRDPGHWRGMRRKAS